MNTTNYRQHLSKDPCLLKLIETIEPRKLERSTNLFSTLCSSILSQQLATKVARVINTRFLELFENKPAPSALLLVKDETLRKIGLSNAKVNYVKNVARYFIDECATDDMLNSMSDDEVIEFLTKIKGVGRWTVEMLMIFAMGREDVFAIDDLGIQQGMAKLFNLDTGNNRQLRKEMLALSAKWSPYRTYACLYIWDFKDNASK